MQVKYKMVADILQREIDEGLYNENNRIPTEDELRNRFEVSRNTIRKAIELLVQRGRVYQVRGSGVFVRNTKKHDVYNIISIQNMNGVTKDFPHKKVRTKVLDFKLINADEELAEKMECKVGAPIYFVNRLRFLDDEVYTIEYSFFNKELILYLNEEIINGSIYGYIREDLKLNIGLVDRIFYADYISDRDAELLDLEKNAPALVNENTARLANGEIFDYSKSISNYKNVQFTFLSNLK